MTIIYNYLKELGFSNIAIIIVILSFFIDITPATRFQPIRWIVRKFGEAFNESIDKKMENLVANFDETFDGINEKFDGIEKEVSEIKNEQRLLRQELKDEEKSVDLTELNRIKREIIQFSDLVQSGMKFSSEEYRIIFDEYSRYLFIVQKYSELENGRINPEITFIQKHYEEHKGDGAYKF